MFNKKILFRANEYQRFCWLVNNEHVLKPKIVGRGLMVSEFVCTFHGKIVDPDTGKPCRVILDCSKNYDGYWTEEDSAIKI